MGVPHHCIEIIDVLKFKRLRRKTKGARDWV
jgi:hypothetical protein